MSLKETYIFEGMTGQFAAVDEMLTGLENLAIMGKLHRLKKPKE